MQSHLLVPLVIGLTSSLHCLGMCGAISAALSASLSPLGCADHGRRLLYTLTFSLGRISSYGFAGAFAGGIGSAVADHVAPVAGDHLAGLPTAFLVLATGLYVGDWVPRLAFLDHLGTPLWKVLAPVSRRFIPVPSLTGAFLYGLVWGWLPCGLVYWALFIASAQGNAAQSALFMVIFGVATVPSILGTGILANWMLHSRRIPYAKKTAGLLLIALSLVTLFSHTTFEHHLRHLR